MQDSKSPTTGTACVERGGLGVNGNVKVGTGVFIADQTESTGPASGSIVVNGELEIKGHTSVGKMLLVEGGKMILEGRTPIFRSGRARGSVSEPKSIKAGDRIGRVSWNAFDGTSLVELSRIEATVNFDEDGAAENEGKRSSDAALLFMARSKGPNGM